MSHHPKFSILRIAYFKSACQFSIAECGIHGSEPISCLKSYFIFVSFDVLDANIPQPAICVGSPFTFNFRGLCKSCYIEKQK